MVQVSVVGPRGGRQVKITFILPVIQITGGVGSTLMLANLLQERGHQVSVVYPVVPSKSGVRWRELRSSARRMELAIFNILRGDKVKWFDLKANFIKAPRLTSRWIPDGDVVVATWWANAFDVNLLGETKGKKFHIIRSYETWGGPEELVNESYTLPLYKIAISSRLIEIIEGKFGVHVDGPVLNGVDFSLFFRDKDDFMAHDPKRVGMIYRGLPAKEMKD